MNRTTIGQSGDPTPLRILFIDPHSAFVTWGGELAEHGCDWQIVRMDDTQVALELLQEGRFDAVIVASLSSFERELGVLRRVADYDHRVARILLSPPLSVSKQAKALDVAHRNITQNSDLRDVISAVEQTVTVTRQLYRDKVVRSFAAFRQLPSPPGIYSELTRAVTADHTNARDIAAIVERDPALAARIMYHFYYLLLSKPTSDSISCNEKASQRDPRAKRWMRRKPQLWRRDCQRSSNKSNMELKGRR